MHQLIFQDLTFIDEPDNQVNNHIALKKLRIHYFQHVAHEGLGSIEEWISFSVMN